MWNEDTKVQLRSSFKRAASPYAEKTLNRITQELDGFVDSWQSTVESVCEQRYVLSDIGLGGYHGCLAGRIEAVRVFLNGIADGEAASIERALPALSDLPSPHLCLLLTDDRTNQYPTEPERRQQAIELEKRVQAIEILRRMGDMEAARAEADDIQEAARRIDFIPLVARTEFWRARVAADTGDYKLAEKAAQSAMNIASLAKDHDTYAESLAILIWTVGRVQERFDDVEAYLSSELKTIAQETQVSPTSRAHLFSNVGTVLSRQGRTDEALSYLNEAVALRKGKLGAFHYQTAITRHNRAIVLREGGRLYEAQDDLERALAIYRDTLGDFHSYTARAMGELGVLCRLQGKAKQAEAILNETIELLDSIYGKGQSPIYGYYLNHLGALALRRGDPEASRKQYSAAFEHYSTKMGKKSSGTANAMIGLGKLDALSGDFEKAQEWFEDAIWVLESNPGERFNLAEAYFGLAKTLWDGGHKDMRATKLAQKAQSVLEGIGGPLPESLRAEINTALRVR